MDFGQIIKKLQASPLFSAMETEELKYLVEGGELLNFGLGQGILQSGDDPDAFYLLLSGKARVLAEQNGKEYVVANLKAPDHFGEEAVLEQRPYDFHIRSAADSMVLKVSAESFSQVLDRNPELRGYFEKYINEVSIRAFLKLCTFLTTLSARQIKGLLSQLEEGVVQKERVHFSGRRSRGRPLHHPQWSSRHRGRGKWRGGCRSYRA